MRNMVTVDDANIRLAAVNIALTLMKQTNGVSIQDFRTALAEVKNFIATGLIPEQEADNV